DEICLLPSIQEDVERTDKMNCIIKNYIEFAWETSLKPKVSSQLIEKNIIDGFNDVLKELFFVKNFKCEEYQKVEDYFVRNIILYVQNNKLFLAEILDRINILRSSLQLQILLFACQSDWTNQLYYFLNQLSQFLKNSTPNLKDFMKVINEIKQI